MCCHGTYTPEDELNKTKQIKTTQNKTRQKTKGKNKSPKTTKSYCIANEKSGIFLSLLILNEIEMQRYIFLYYER